jgi:hypothetical protein
MQSGKTVLGLTGYDNVKPDRSKSFLGFRSAALNHFRDATVVVPMFRDSIKEMCHAIFR